MTTATLASRTGRRPMRGGCGAKAIRKVRREGHQGREIAKKVEIGHRLEAATFALKPCSRST
jgi:hypothetical protein